ncbi:MAG: hypothetical protein DHS20C12_08510 [Pseudohongiella sp.]|nr:MAG: hypothetical protein DHS20C12_08510 [Pseudohongiella sp.]
MQTVFASINAEFDQCLLNYKALKTMQIKVGKQIAVFKHRVCSSVVNFRACFLKVFIIASEIEVDTM